MFFAGNDRPILAKLGFDFNWENTFVRTNTRLFPEFEPKIIEHFPDGSRSVRNRDGITVLEVDGAVSIPAEIDHLLKDRKSWEKYYLPRLQFNMKRIQDSAVTIGEKKVPFEAVGREHLAEHGRSDKIYHVLHCGSMIGFIRNLTGVEGLSYIYADDESLLDEIINTVGNLTYQCAEDILRRGARFDMAHFWEDICFKSGPLVIPSMFDEKCGPHYKRITALLNDYGIDIISLDCDGMVDSLIPTWINNGINTMFPIEVGTWNASIGKWRKKYGNKIRGVGGMDKRVFALDKTAVDHEIERLKPFVELGGYIPMPDHHIAPDAHWENVVYYCDRMHSAFC
jgi:uroporphyrinogen decarboxylase